MLRLCTLAGLIAAAHADWPRRFLQSTTCVDGVVDKTGLPCTVCDGESAEDYAIDATWSRGRVGSMAWSFYDIDAMLPL